MNLFKNIKNTILIIRMKKIIINRNLIGKIINNIKIEIFLIDLQ